MDMTRQRVENGVNLLVELVSRLLALFVWRGSPESEIGRLRSMLFHIGQLLSLHTQTLETRMGSQSLPPSEGLGLKKVLHGSSGGVHPECLSVPFRNSCYLMLRIQVGCGLPSGKLMTVSRVTWNWCNGRSRSILGCDFASCLRYSISDEV